MKKREILGSMLETVMMIDYYLPETKRNIRYCEISELVKSYPKKVMSMSKPQLESLTLELNRFKGGTAV